MSREDREEMQESMMSESTKLVIREENDEEDETIDPDAADNQGGIDMGNEKHIKIPL